MLKIASILARQSPDGGPVEPLAALGEEPHESIVQQVGKRHRYPQVLGCGEREADVLVAEGAANAAGSNLPSAIRGPKIL
jgi:hypothetical protein